MNASEEFVIQADEALVGMKQHVSVGLFATGPNEAELHEIYASEMRRGWGTKAMQLICDLATQHGITLTLEVDNDAGDWTIGAPLSHLPSDNDLIRWYASFDFRLSNTLTPRIKMIRKA